LAALDRQRAFVEAQQVRVIQAMTAAADRPACPLDKDFVRDEVAAGPAAERPRPTTAVLTSTGQAVRPAAPARGAVLAKRWHPP
jgi:hypothetical protein